MEKIIYQKNEYRIREIQDLDYKMEDLKGECFNSKVNNDIDPQQLKQEESRFERKVWEDGVYGYILEKWYPEIDKGWMYLDSCFGFVGPYSTENHYIVDEFKDQIE